MKSELEELRGHKVPKIVEYIEQSPSVWFATCFRIYLENMKMSFSLPKILETGINIFISNSQIITIKIYYEKYI